MSFYENTLIAKQDLPKTELGKIKEIGSVKINYNENYSANVNKGFVGKIKNIGNVKFNYFKSTYNNNASGITGKFQSMNGNDARFIIY